MANFKSFFYWAVVPVTIGILIYNNIPKERLVTPNGANISMISSYYLSFLFKPLLRHFYKLPTSTWEGKHYSKELENPVTVYRDELGIPYIYAECDEDLFFTQGYVTALERSAQITQMTTFARGKLSQFLGKKFIQSDVEMRGYDLENKAKRLLEQASPTLKAMLHHYSRGVDHAFKNMPKKQLEHFSIPLPSNWTDLDSTIVMLILSIKLNRGWNSEISLKVLEQNLTPELMNELKTNFDPDMGFVNPEGPNPAMYDLNGNKINTPNDYKSTLKHAYNTFGQQNKTEKTTENNPNNTYNADSTPLTENERTGYEMEIDGSNAWAISGEYTYSGKPIIAGDMHLLQNAPGTFFPVFLESTNSTIMRNGTSSLKAIGASVPGIPGILAGHNEYIGISMTVSYIDSDDLFEVELSEDGLRYKWDGEEIPLDIHEEEIHVNGFKEPVILELKRTHHGPLITSLYNKGRYEMKPNNALAISNPLFRSDSGAEGIRSFSARTWEELFEYLTSNNSIELVATWGDIYGNIGSFLIGDVPIRKGGAYPFRDGTRSDHDWLGYYKNSEVGHTMNPKRGFAVSANSLISPDPENKYGRCSIPSDRQTRITNILEAYTKMTPNPKLTVNDFQIMQTDQYSISSCEWKNIAWNIFLKDFDNTASTQFEFDPQIPHFSIDLATKLAAEMKQWDCIVTSTSRYTAFYEAWLNILIRTLLENSDLPQSVQNEVLGKTLNSDFLHEMGAHARSTLMRLLRNPENSLFMKQLGDLRHYLAVSLGQLLKITERLYGHPTLELKWDDVQSLFFIHPISMALPVAHHTVSIGPFNPGGNFGTIHVSRVSLNMEDNLGSKNYFKSSVGPLTRIVMDTHDWTKSKWLVLPGTSGWIASKHYGDQLEYLKAGKLHPMLWKSEDIMEHAVTTLKMYPE